MTDHMLITNFDPINGWSAPEIKPYGPISVDPAGSCFQYSTNVFEGMKVRPQLIELVTSPMVMMFLESH